VCEGPYDIGSEVHSWYVFGVAYFLTRVESPWTIFCIFHYNKHAQFLMKGLRQPSAVATPLQESNITSEISLILFISTLKIPLSLVQSASNLTSLVCLLKMDFWEVGGVGTGWSWLRIGTDGGHL